MTPRAYATVLAWAAREGLREHMACLTLLHVVEPAPGVRLLCLPVAQRGFHGCYLHAGRATKRAAWWLDRLAYGGHMVVRVGPASEVIAALRTYLARPGLVREAAA